MQIEFVKQASKEVMQAIQEKSQKADGPKVSIFIPFDNQANFHKIKSRPFKSRLASLLKIGEFKLNDDYGIQRPEEYLHPIRKLGFQFKPDKGSKGLMIYFDQQNCWAIETGDTLREEITIDRQFKECS